MSGRPTVGGGPRPLRLGTRGSRLALVQARAVESALREAGAAVELVAVRTAGDERPPDTAWGEGAFVGALEQALLGGEIDLAVHSAKDVPTTEDPRLVVAAYTRREDPRDVLVCRQRGATLETLPRGARVGTDSPRRAAFLLARRPDLRIHPLHGNVDTRLRRLDAGETDALVLAAAGLLRLGWADRIDAFLPPDVVAPAPGQGALAVQCRADDARTVALLAGLDDPPTRAAVETERAFLTASGGGCRAPLGALARVERGRVRLLAGAARGLAPVPLAIAWGEEEGPIAEREAVAGRLADRLSGRRRVLVTRPVEQAGPLLEALSARDLEPVPVPTIELRPAAPGGALDDAVRRVGTYAWVVVTSANGAAAVVEATARLGVDPARARWAAVGSATARALDERGVPVTLQAARTSGAGLAEELPIAPGDRVLLLRADAADGLLPARLKARGALVDEVVAYRTVEAPASSRAPLRDALAGGPLAALVFTSGSTVRGLLRLAPEETRPALLALPACCIGPSTAAVAREEGFGLVLEAPVQSAEAVADLVAAIVAARKGAP